MTVTRPMHLVMAVGAMLLAAALWLIVAAAPAQAQVVQQPTAAEANALTSTTCGSAVSSCVLKSSSGNLYGVYAQCTDACWLMVFNALALPSNGSTTAGSASGNLMECVDVAANTAKSLTYPTFPRHFSVGVVVAISSSACGTLTASAVGFVSGTVK